MRRSCLAARISTRIRLSCAVFHDGAILEVPPPGFPHPLRSSLLPPPALPPRLPPFLLPGFPRQTPRPLCYQPIPTRAPLSADVAECCPSSSKVGRHRRIHFWLESGQVWSKRAPTLAEVSPDSIRLEPARLGRNRTTSDQSQPKSVEIIELHRGWGGE